MRRHISTLLSLLLAAGVWTAGATPALAHEDAVLEVDRSAVASGDSVVLNGTEFTAGVEYQLRLVGTLDDHDLGKVRTDSTGRFRLAVSVPTDAGTGRYQLVAVAGDGDEVARVEMRVTRKEGQPSQGGDEEGAAGDTREPRTDDMDLSRERSGAEWALVLLLIGGSGGLGLFVLQRAGGPS